MWMRGSYAETKDARDRYPRGCESENHDAGHRFCWGWLRRCPVCERRICYEDGGAPDPIVGICDTCWTEVDLSNPGSVT